MKKMTAKLTVDEIDDRIIEMEIKHPKFIGMWMSDAKKRKLISMVDSKQYKFIFQVFQCDTFEQDEQMCTKVKKYKANGYRVFDSVYNYEATAYIFYYKKKTE